MEKVAYLLDGQFIYWRSIILACAICCALLAAIGARLLQGQRLAPLLITMPLAIIAGLYASRAIHWYCRFESYAGFLAAVTDFTGGGYSLMGVFAGVILACLLMRALCLTRDLPGLLDAIAPAGALGIAVGRLSDYFSSSDRAKFFLPEAWQHLPWSAPTVNATSGAVEWRAATFCFQSAWCALLFLFLTLRLVLRFRRVPAREGWRSGRVFALFMLAYCLAQIVFDSTRYDALFLRSNGFVSLEQIVCAVVAAAFLALYSVRSIQKNGFRFWHPLLWLGALAGLGLAGFMEYYVQRHGNLYLFCYGMMSVGLAVLFCMIQLMYRSTTVPASEAGAEAVPEPVPRPEPLPVAAVAGEPEPRAFAPRQPAAPAAEKPLAEEEYDFSSMSLDDIIREVRADTRDDAAVH